MKRDMDLVRDLLLNIENSNKPSWKSLAPTDDDAATQNVLEHLKLMEEAGLIKSVVVHMKGYRLPQDIELEWAGHDFLDSVRDPEIWARTKTGAEAAKGFTFDLLKDLAKGFLKTQIKERTGVDV